MDGKLRAPAVGFVLLIACINVASLFVARASARRREIAIRKALGATRGRLTQQFLAEALLLLAAGSALGLVAARWGTRALVALAPGDFYSSFDVSIDARVLAVTGGLTMLTALVFSILPGLRGRPSDAEQSLRTEQRSSTADRRSQHGRRVLIVSEVAFALVLTHQQIVRHLRELPGVMSVSTTSDLPMQGEWLIVFTPEGSPPSQLPVATNALVLPGFFEAMRVPLRAGRVFNDQGYAGRGGHQRDDGAQYYGNANPVGRQFGNAIAVS